MMISNRHRDFVAEATAAGSAATTKRGALRYLIDQHYHPTYSASRPWKREIVERRGSRIAGTPPWRQLNGRDYRAGEGLSASEWKRLRDARKSDPEAKRARHDKGFRRQFLASLAREERRLIKTPGRNPDTAYARLEQIAEVRHAAGLPKRPVPPRPWRTRSEVSKEVYRTARAAGLANNWDGSSYCDGRGDYHCLTVIDAAEAPAYLATPGTCLGLVEHRRRRVYANSSQFAKSDRSDYYVTGRNENGNAFLHQVPHTAAGYLSEAMAWIWQGAEIIARQGDIAIAASPLKNRVGEDMDTAVGHGHSRHRFIGEVYVNGSIHVRSGFLIHTADQHPPIYLDGSCWRRIIIGRRSERRMSTAD